MICYIPSYNDSELVRFTLDSIPDWQVVISDNASDEPHRSQLAAMASDRVTIVRNPRNLGRVGNWQSCVRLFVASGQPWMKFLLAGDRHKPNSLDIYRRAMSVCPAARYIIAQVEMHWTTNTHVWAPAAGYLLVPPLDAMNWVVRSGNVFHGLSAAMFHRDTVTQSDPLADEDLFGEEILSFGADLLFLMMIGQKTETLYVPEIVTEFHVKHRKQFQFGIQSLEHYLEELLMRLRAANISTAMTGDLAQRSQMIAHLTAWMQSGMTRPLERLTADTRYVPASPSPTR